MKVLETINGNTKEILKFVDHYVGCGKMLSATGVVADGNGKKIVPAGTLVGAEASGTVSVVNDFTTEGVLLHDVDVTYGDAPCTMIIHGFIDSTKIPAQPSTGVDLPMIKFL